MSENLYEVLMAGAKSRVDGGFESVFTFRALGNLLEAEFVEKIKEVFLEAVSIRNDKAALGALRIIATFYDNPLWNSHERNKECFREFQTSFWAMPYAEDNGMIELPSTMEESKKFIIQWAMREWSRVNSYSQTKVTPYARSLFQFVAEDCYHPIPKPAREILFGEKEHFFKDKTRSVFEKNKKMIEDVVRDAVKYNVSYTNLQLWLKESWIPDGLAKILAIAWARNGGYRELMK